MSAELEIVFTDRSGQAMPPPGSQFAPSPVQPNQQTTTTPKPQPLQGPTATPQSVSSVLTGMTTEFLEMAAKGLGFGNLWNASKSLHAEFLELIKASREAGQSLKDSVKSEPQSQPVQTSRESPKPDTQSTGPRLQSNEARPPANQPSAIDDILPPRAEPQAPAPAVKPEPVSNTMEGPNASPMSEFGPMSPFDAKQATKFSPPPTPTTPAASTAATATTAVEGAAAATVVEPIAPAATAAASTAPATATMAVEGAAAGEALAGAAAGGTQAASAMSSLAAAAGPVGVAFAVVVAAAALTVVAVNEITKAFHKFASELEGFSPEISMASANNEVRMEQAQMRRAEQIGPELANVENDYGRMQEALYDLQTQVLNILLKLYKVIEPVVEIVINGITVVVSIPEILSALTSQVLAAFTKNKADDIAAAKSTANALSRLSDALTGEENDAGAIDPFFEQLRTYAMGLTPAGLPRVPAAGGV